MPIRHWLSCNNGGAGGGRCESVEKFLVMLGGGVDSDLELDSDADDNADGGAGEDAGTTPHPPTTP